MKHSLHCNLVKAGCAFAFSISFLAITGAALAVDDSSITYVFNASKGQLQDLNGSTVTIGNPTQTPDDPDVLSWNIDVDGTHYTDGVVFSEDITSYNNDGFVGFFQIQDGSLWGGELIIGSDNDGNSTFGNPAGGTLNGYIDPNGSWTLQAGNSVNPLPDEASTMALLSGAFLTMVGFRRRFSRR